MKIAAIEPILIAVPYRHGGPTPEGDATPWRTMDTLLLRVATDDGVTGWGEAFGFGACAATAAAVATLVAPLCVGRDPRQRDVLRAELARKLHNFGDNGPVSFALSGLDIALWDIAGHLAGEPLHRLLGSAAPGPTLPAYASLLRYGDPALVARNAGEAVGRGYGEIKVHEVGEAEIAAARSAVGADVPLAVDANCAWPADEAVKMARRLQVHALKWLEEPVWPPNDYDGLARLRREGGVAVAAGENIGSPAAFARLVRSGAVDYVQPSVTKVGGVSAMREIISAAQTAGVRVAPHSPYFGPGLAATLHLCAALLPGVAVERFYCDLEASPLGEAVEAAQGAMRLPTGPGLGIVVDEGLLARYRVQ